MRWERLFSELEAQAGDVERLDRDALVDELRDGDWAETSWVDLLGGHVVLEVMGLGRLDGQVVLANERIVQLRTESVDHVINASAVVCVVSSERRAASNSAVVAALGWGHIYRTLRDLGSGVRLCKVDGATFAGSVDVVGRDFVRIRDTAARDHVVPFDAVAVVSGRT